MTPSPDSEHLVLGTRGSDLALWQANRVAHRIRHELGLACAIEVVKTQGDRIQNVAFHKMEGKGFFTKELQEALLDGRVDLVVHSLKDLPTTEPPGLEVVAIPERGTSADLLHAPRGGISPTDDHPLGLGRGAVVGTSSLRRAAQLLDADDTLRLRALRGNLPTRIGKLREGRYDAILVAAAGVERLELELDDLDLLELSPAVMRPAPGQGALAVETRADDPRTAVLARLHDPAVARGVQAERRLLQLLEGGCHLPLGCSAHVDGGTIELAAVLGEVDEELTRARVVRATVSGASPEAVAQACHDALRTAMPAEVHR